MPVKAMPIIDRIMLDSIPEPMSGCWIWTGPMNSSGYGQVQHGKRGRKLAHRASWECFVGPIGHGLVVCHKCDNKLCVNPTHLFVGTQKDNIRDMDRKGRAFRPVFRGCDHPRAKFSNDTIKQVISDNRSLRIISLEHGISKTHVARLKKAASALEVAE